MSDKPTFVEFGDRVAKEYGMTGLELAYGFLEKYDDDFSIPSQEKLIMGATICRLESEAARLAQEVERLRIALNKCVAQRDHFISVAYRDFTEAEETEGRRKQNAEIQSILAGGES